MCITFTLWMYVTGGVQKYICDRIYKKGSYMRTTLEHRFHHHSIDPSSDNLCMHVLWPTVHPSAFPEAAFLDMSGVHEYRGKSDTATDSLNISLVFLSAKDIL